MPDYDIDPVFEKRLEGGLRSFSEEGLTPYDAMEITTMVTMPPDRKPEAAPVRGRAESSSAAWLRAAIGLALLAALLLAVGFAGGFIKLPTNNVVPNPTFQPSGPPLPTSGAGQSAVPGESPVVSFVPGSGVPSSLVPGSAAPSTLPTSVPTVAPSAEVTPGPTADPGFTPVPTLTPEPSPTVAPTPEPLAILDADAGDQVWCALAVDLRVYCWGSNNEGELGDGTNDDRLTANVPVLGISNATDIATGIRFACAALGDGTVWCWGEDPGSDENLNRPRQVPSINDAEVLASGGQHACALRLSNGIWCWGLGNIGQLGNGVISQTSGEAEPVAVSGIDDAAEISAGWNHTCALRNDGTIWCWGGNEHGQLGDGTLENRPAPVQAGDISDFTSLAAGGFGTCGIRSNETVWCWGDGDRGTLGDGNSTDSAVPVQVSGLIGAQRIAMGFFTVCAWTNPDIYCWGEVAWAGSATSATPIEGDGDARLRVMAVDRNLVFVDSEQRLWQWWFEQGALPELVIVGPQ